MLSSSCFDRLRDLSSGFSASRTLQTYRSIVRDDWILAQWYIGRKNWGDSINPVVIEHLSGKKAIQASTVPNIYGLPIYMVIGSILDTCNNKNTMVWGAGFIAPSSRFKVRPKQVFAVRGPRTRDILLKNGVACPEVYGDPAIIFPMVFKPDVKKVYDLGIVPHYMDAGSPLIKRLKGIDGVKVIDIGGDIYRFVEEVCQCKAIISSSLHGLIAADAYKLPSQWIKLSNRVLGNDFKFYDYYEGVGIIDSTPYHLDGSENIDEMVATCRKNYVNIDTSDLLEACPFAQGNAQ